MRLALVFCFLTMVGSAAVPAHAQTPTDPSFIIHGSPCVEVYCIDLAYTGPTTCFTYILPCPNPTPPPIGYPSSGDGPFLFALATPITGIPILDLGLYNCSAADLPGIALDDFTFSGGTATFLGCDYFGLLTDGQTFTWNASVPSPLAPNPLIEVVPEPTSFVLFTSGLVIFCLGGFTRRRLAGNFSN